MRQQPTFTRRRKAEPPAGHAPGPRVAETHQPGSLDDAAADDQPRLSAALIEARMDPTSADGRAGLGALLLEPEGFEPGVVRQLALGAR